MPSTDDLRAALLDCKVIDSNQWDQAAPRGGEADLDELLDALRTTAPWWWDGTPPVPLGLTDFQRETIKTHFTDKKFPRLRRALVMNQFLLLDHLGEGGQGQVYRARQLRPGRDVAIKILTQDTDDRRRRFEQEARAMMQVSHPAVARCYLYERVRDDAGAVTDDYLIAMEFIDGTDLQRLVRRSGPVPWRFAAWWAAQLLDGLHQVHKGGFIHRDVKPENVMIVGPAPAAGGNPEATAAKLLDMGAAKPVGADAGDGITRQGVFIGTPEYAPPEQWNRSQPLTAASDIYALGGTLFYALTGRTPYHKPMRDAIAFLTAHLNDPVPDVREHAPTVPVEVSRVLQKMMAKDPAVRGTSAELAAELRSLMGRTHTPAGTGLPRPAPPPAPRRTTPGVAVPPAAVLPPAPRASPPPVVLPPPPIQTAGDYERGRQLAAAIDPVLRVFERLFLPAAERPSNADVNPGERIAALVRRPLVIVLFVVTFFLLVRCIW